MTTFYLVDDGRSMPRWCELVAEEGSDGWWWVDAKGRKRSYDDFSPVAHVTGDNILATTDVPQVIARYERDKAMTYLLDPKSDQGWVAPDGRFYGCAFFAHDDLAHALLRKSVGALEDEGWLRVNSEVVRSGHRAATEAQRRTVDELGFEMRGGSWQRRATPGKPRSPPSRAVRRTASTERPVVEIAVTASPSVADVDRLVARLAGSDGSFSGWEPGTYEVYLDFGGRWTWMATRDDATIGGEERPDVVWEAEGIAVERTSFDTAEVTPWPVPGVRLGDGVRDLLAGSAPRP